MFFSVIIPTFNRSEFIEATINSVLNQNTTIDYEIIVVDDGSTDKTLDILNSYGNKITILTQKNQGPSSARNLGIEFAKGEYVTFLDSDDLWFSWTLSIYHKVVLNYNYPTFISGKELNFENNLDLHSINQSDLKILKYDDYYASADNYLWIGTCSTAIKKDVLTEIGGFCSKNINAEDSDLWLRLGTAKGFVYIESPYLFAYRRHPHSAVSDFRKTYNGISYLINQEKNNLYPGGEQRKLERLNILTTHIRPVSIECLKKNAFKDGWILYQQTFLWHLKLIRLRYLLVFPLFLIIKVLISYL